MAIVIESRRKKLENIAKRWPDAQIFDLTSKGTEPWVRFSPFYPHGGIPLPNTPGAFAQSVEGLWQGLKVFEREDIDPSKWSITSMSGLKRSGKSRGAVLGHRFGVKSEILLGYAEARRRIYLPAFLWVLEKNLAQFAEALRTHAAEGTLVLLDYETNEDVDDLSRPLSHASLVKYYLTNAWPAWHG